jgi:hypothetical protein
MDAVVVLEWKFSPPDYFESQIDIKEGDCTMIIANGKAEAKIDSAIYDATPSIRDTLHDVLNSRFLGFQLSSRKAYNLSSPTKTRVEHADGRKDYIMEVEPMQIDIIFHPITLLHCDTDGNVIADGQTEKMKCLGDLVRKHANDEVLKSLLKSHNASVSDPDDELVHLYEIRDALSRRFGSDARARSTLGISKREWSDFGKLCNIEPLKQGRHRGEHKTLRYATDIELSEVRGTAKVMIEAYLKYLDMAANSV